MYFHNAWPRLFHVWLKHLWFSLSQTPGCESGVDKWIKLPSSFVWLTCRWTWAQSWRAVTCWRRRQTGESSSTCSPRCWPSTQIKGSHPLRPSIIHLLLWPTCWTSPIAHSEPQTAAEHSHTHISVLSETVHHSRDWIFTRYYSKSKQSLCWYIFNHI